MPHLFLAVLENQERTVGRGGLHRLGELAEQEQVGKQQQHAGEKWINL